MSGLDDTIAEAVTEVLERVLRRSRTTFSLAEDLVRDLKIASDDLSFMFVPELERKLNVQIPAKEWLSVHTGADACSLLKRHLMPRADD